MFKIKVINFAGDVLYVGLTPTDGPLNFRVSVNAQKFKTEEEARQAITTFRPTVSATRFEVVPFDLKCLVSEK
jgi:hypothetical protein